jgi:hypothetical protein
MKLNLETCAVAVHFSTYVFPEASACVDVCVCVCAGAYAWTKLISDSMQNSTIFVQGMCPSSTPTQTLDTVSDAAGGRHAHNLSVGP